MNFTRMKISAELRFPSQSRPHDGVRPKGRNLDCNLLFFQPFCPLHDPSAECARRNERARNGVRLDYREDRKNSPMGRAFFTVIAAISQLERELIGGTRKKWPKKRQIKGSSHRGERRRGPVLRLEPFVVPVSVTSRWRDYERIGRRHQRRVGGVAQGTGPAKPQIADEMADHAAEKSSKNVAGAVAVWAKTTRNLG